VHNKEQILLKIDCFKEFCFTAATIESKKIYKYYIKMEKIIFKYIQEQYTNQQNIIIENKKALEDKEQLLEIKELEDKNKEIKEKEKIINTFKSTTYEEAEKMGYIYLLSTN
jgi:hypothetical protein